MHNFRRIQKNTKIICNDENIKELDFKYFADLIGEKVTFGNLHSQKVDPKTKTLKKLIFYHWTLMKE